MKFRCGKGSPVLEYRRQRDGGSQGQHSAHACPGHDKDLFARGTRLYLVQQVVSYPIGDHRTRKHPDNSQRHDQDRERCPVANQLAHGMVVDAAQYQSNLQAHENKDEAVEAELQRLPHRGALDARVDRECLRTFAPEIKAADHGCEHARRMDPLCGKVSQVRGGKGQSDFHGRVGDLE